MPAVVLNPLNPSKHDVWTSFGRCSYIGTFFLTNVNVTAALPEAAM